MFSMIDVIIRKMFNAEKNLSFFNDALIIDDFDLD
jgi:hypothetical protein